MKKIFSIGLLFLVAIADLPAAFVSVKTGTATLSYLGAPYVMDYDVQIDTSGAPILYFQVLVKATHTNITLPNPSVGIIDYRLGFSYKRTRFSPPGTLTLGGYGETGYFDLRQSAGVHTYGPSQFVAGDKLDLRFFSGYQANYSGTPWIWQDDHTFLSFEIPTVSTTYFVTFPLPVNDTEHRKDYFATQAGVTVGATYQLSGAFARQWKVGPLTLAAPVSLSVVTGGRTGWDAVNGLIIPTSETLSTQLNPGIIPVVGTGSTGDVANPTDVVTGVVTTPAPTVTTPTGGGGGLVNVPGTNGTTTAATTGDISQVTAGVATGANGVITNATSNANGIIGAVNKSITALDKINATLEASKGGSFDDGNIVAGLSSVKSSVDDFKTVTQAHWTAETATLTAAKTAAQADADSRANSISGNMAAAKDAAASSASTFAAVPGVASSLQLATVNPTPSDNGWALQPYLMAVSNSVVMSGIAGGGGLDLNPFTSPQLANLIGTGTALTICIWIKSFITWAVVIAFLTWTFGQVKENVIAMMTVPQMALPGSTQLVSRTAVLGNSVGVIPAAGLYVFQQLALATFLLASPAITVAILMDTGSAGTLATAASTAAAHTSGSATGFCANALSCMFVVCPVATIITVFLNGLLVRIGSITQFIVTGVVTRTIGV